MQLTENRLVDLGRAKYENEYGKIIVINNEDGTCTIIPKFKESGILYESIKIDYPPSPAEGLTLNYKIDTENGIDEDTFNYINSDILQIVERWNRIKADLFIMENTNGFSKEASKKAIESLYSTKEYEFLKSIQLK